MGASWLLTLGQLLLLFLVPAAVAACGAEPDRLVLLLSAIAAGAELAKALCCNCKRKRGQLLWPSHLFLLQLCLLYVVQLWFLQVGGSMSVHFATDSVARVPPAAVSALRATLAPAPAEPAAAGPDALAGAHSFQLDALPEELRWSPRTISVVLPCAEEREFALKTVQSFYEATPADILREIVVVDDGSNPPLASTHLRPEVQRRYKVRVLRHEETVGLIGAKKTGGDAAVGDIVGFFDCHVAPQRDWYKDFLSLIGENYRRMVVPQITALNIDTWKQEGQGGGMSKCYVTWDGDFKWGGTDDMYMAMLSGGLAAMSKRWWNESGGFDDQMLGWGGENIDQGIRMWLCGGEIVAAPHAQVAHMWRAGDPRTGARYRHVGDTSKNRARAIYAWYGEFVEKLDDFPEFKRRKSLGGQAWYGDLSSFQRVKDRLQGCRPFAWYLRRFKGIYEDGGILPPEIFMLKEATSGQCLRFQGRAGTSPSGREGVVLSPCDANNHRYFWHLGNRHRKTRRCCSGLRAWNTEQCLAGGQGHGKAVTSICEISGSNHAQDWALRENGELRRRDQCLGPGDSPGTLEEKPCSAFRSQGGSRFTKEAVSEPLETRLYRKAMREHPEVFSALITQQELEEAAVRVPAVCREQPSSCITLTLRDGRGRCLDDEGQLVSDRQLCGAFRVLNRALRHAEAGTCLDNWSDTDAETWGLYACHSGKNQQFAPHGTGEYCNAALPAECFQIDPWPATALAKAH